MIYELNFLIGGLSKFLSNLPIFFLPVVAFASESESLPFKKFLVNRLTNYEEFEGNLVLNYNILDPSNGGLVKRIFDKSERFFKFQKSTNEILSFLISIHLILLMIYTSIYILTNIFWFTSLCFFCILGGLIISLLNFFTLNQFLVKIVKNPIKNFLILNALFLSFCFLINLIFKPVPYLVVLIFILVDFLWLLKTFLNLRYVVKSKRVAFNQGLIFGLILGLNYHQSVSKFLRSFFSLLINLKNAFKFAFYVESSWLKPLKSFIFWWGSVLILLKILLLVICSLFLGFCLTLDFFKSPLRKSFMAPSETDL